MAASSRSLPIPDDTNNSGDTFVHDRKTGVTTRVSIDSVGNQANRYTFNPAISTNGRFVAFDSYADNLVPGDTNVASDVFVRDRKTGSTERVSVDSGGNQGNAGIPGSYDAAISGNGRFVAFDSTADNLVPGDTNGRADIFVHDRKTGATERVRRRLRRQSGQQRQLQSHYQRRWPLRRVLLPCRQPGSRRHQRRPDVFVHDRKTGATERVSVDSAGNQGNSGSFDPAISANGRFVAFWSSASNLVPGNTNGPLQIFVHDRKTGTTDRVSVDSAGNQANGLSIFPAISGNGRFVTFLSSPNNLVPGDTNGAEDLFVHDRKPELIETGDADLAGE